jgi:hypothetical protein
MSWVLQDQLFMRLREDKRPSSFLHAKGHGVLQQTTSARDAAGGNL